MASGRVVLFTLGGIIAMAGTDRGAVTRLGGAHAGDGHAGRDGIPDRPELAAWMLVAAGAGRDAICRKLQRIRLGR